jgi:NAD(P)H-flavin reductase/ferredoxin
MTTHRVEFRGDAVVTAREGQTILDAALLNGIELPHDCRAGQCGSCRVTLLDGRTSGGEIGPGSSVLACQARVTGPIAVEIEPVPALDTAWGMVRAVTDLGCGVVEVAIAPSRPVACLPGQYLSFRFRGFPTRRYSPTLSIVGQSEAGLIYLHVRRVRGGIVSQAFGQAILAGHRVRIRGPFGSSFFRPNRPGRMVLVGAGTGFAPVWAIAQAALTEDPEREIMVIAGARSLSHFYMGPALESLERNRNVSIRVFVERHEPGTPHSLVGTAADRLPPLWDSDTVFACGAPDTVENVRAICAEAGVACHTDSFAAAPDPETPRETDRAGLDMDALVTRLAPMARDRKLCVLVSATQGDAGRGLSASLAAALGTGDVVVVGAGVKPRRDLSFWHTLSVPPGLSGSGPCDEEADWPSHVAAEIDRFYRDNRVVIICTPPLERSSLAWFFAAISDVTVLATSGTLADRVAAKGLGAQGSMVVELATSTMLSVAA